MLCLLVSCSGYRFTQQDNPLSQYGIQSLSVPMFYNYSNLPEVSGEFTREVYTLLTGFGGLKLVNGYNQNTDAVMIGIIKTPEKIVETLRPGAQIVATNRVKEATKDRQRFYIPGTTNVSLYLQVVIIKKPSEEDLALLRSGLGEQIKMNSRIVVNELIPVNAVYTREIFDREAVTVTATQNFGIQRKTIKTMAENAAISVRDLILYAF